MALSSETKNPCPSHIGSVSTPSLARGPDGFERTLARMLGELASAPSNELACALAESLRDLCRVGGLGLAGVLEPSSQRSQLVVRVEATGVAASVGSLIAAWSEQTHRRVRSELAWSSPCVIDADDPQPSMTELAASLRTQGLKSCAIARLDLEGRPFGCLVLASSSRHLLDGASFSRVRLLADLIALALARLDVPRALAHSQARSARLELEDSSQPGLLTEAELRELERTNLLRTLESCAWKVQGPTGAARALGLSPSTLRDRMKSFGLRRP